MSTRAAVFRWLVTAGLALASVALQAEVPPETEAWYRIYADNGALIGIQHEAIVHKEEGWEVSRTRTMGFRVEGHDPTRSTSSVVQRFDRDGRVVSFVQEEEVNGNRRRVIADIADGTASIAIGKRAAGRFPFPEGHRFLDDEALLGVPGAAKELVRYDAADGTLDRLDVQMFPGPTPGSWSRVAFEQGMPTRIVLIEQDDSGKTQRASLPLFGTRINFESADGPLDAGVLSSGRTIPHQLVKALYAIPRSALQGHIRYGFARRSDIGVPLPETGEQRMAEEGNRVVVDVCGGCGPGLSTEPEDLERWRRPTAWLQSDASEIAGIGALVRDSGSSESEKMAALGRRARDRMKDVDYVGHYSAREAWERRAGDCTEDAALFAALARAAGIPARVANGIVYSRDRYHGESETFVPHSWVVAYVDGEWRSFDISVDGHDASHIAFMIGDGEPEAVAAANQLAGLVELTEMAEVRRRPE
jgi:hypothetical protein